MKRKRVLGIVAVGLVALGTVVAASPGLRRKLAAAARAFGDPGLVYPPSLATSCGPAEENPLVIDRTLAREHSPVDPSDDTESPDITGMSDLRPADLPVEVTRRALRFAKFFGKNTVGRETFLTRYRRAGKYRREMERELREAGLPDDLVWVAAIESGFDPRAGSTAGASGIWQFMPETGALYGLEQSKWLDERRSLRRATAAAVAHLRDLHERLGRWDLVLAAYNAGYSAVLRALDEYEELRKRAPKEDAPSGPGRFSDLAQAGLLPDETTDYVPKIVGFALVAANLARFDLDETAAADPLDLSELTVPEGTPLRAVARAGGVSLASLRDLNPELLRDRTPPEGGGYTILVPAERYEQIRAALPAYLDNLVLSVDDSEPTPGETRLGTNGDFITVYGGRRPGHLGLNRLPAFPVPGTPAAGASAALRPRGPIEHILPTGLGDLDVGWRAEPDDPFALFARNARQAKTHADARALAGELAFLKSDAPVRLAELPFITQQLAGGIELRMRRDASAPRVAITVRAGGEPRSLDPQTLEGHAADVRYTDTVKSSDLDLGVTLAVGRLGLALAAGRSGPVAALRHELGADRRRLESLPGGAAWRALGAAMFPVEGAGGGRALGPDTLDRTTFVGGYLLAELGARHAASAASLTLIGDFDPATAAVLVQKALAELGAGASRGLDQIEARVGKRPVVVVGDEKARDTRALFGWVGPGVGVEGEIAARLALEILAGKKDPVLGRTLLARGLATAVHAHVDLAPDANALVIEVVGPADVDVGAIDAELEHAIAPLAERGPSTLELAIAKAMLKYRLNELAKRADPAAEPSDANLDGRLWRTLAPGVLERELAACEKAGPAAVRDAFRKQLAPLRRFAVAIAPPKAATPGDAPPSKD
ncbi:MAG: transglycosylase SLT domain-containing protein [Myxococcales bacterium]|nr:transglycosylase SLT domain-containing protein [Myxococcales bacterium]